MRNLRRFAMFCLPLCVAAAVPAVAGTPAHASVARVLGVATGFAQSPTGAVARITILAEQTTNGTVQARATVCGTSCSEYAVQHAQLTFQPTTALNILGDLPAFGAVDVAVNANAGNTYTYQCADTATPFSIEGADVEPAYVAGGIGDWTFVTTGCAAWARNSAIQFVNAA